VERFQQMGVLILGGGAEGGNKYLPISIRSSDCIGRYNRRFQGPILYRAILSALFRYRYFDQPILFGLQVPILYLPIV
jgi:hypothetical protein